jgi:hypothetical protein
VKPDEPNEFLLTELRKIQQMKANNEPVTLFTEADMINMFSIFDLTGRGYVTQLQYARGQKYLCFSQYLFSPQISLSLSISLSPSLSLSALEAVGVDPTQAKYTPSGDGIDKITFVKHL